MTRTIFLTLVFAASACGPQMETAYAQSSAALSSEDATALLSLVNDTERTTFDVLDIDCAIRSDSARQIIRHRDGSGKKATTDLFDSVQELEDVAMVGPWTIGRLVTCAWNRGYGKATGWTTSLEVGQWGGSYASVSPFGDGTAAVLYKGLASTSTGTEHASYFRTFDGSTWSAAARVDGGMPQYTSSYGTDVTMTMDHRLVPVPGTHEAWAAVLARYSTSYLNSEGLLYTVMLRHWDGSAWGDWFRGTPVGSVSDLAIDVTPSGQPCLVWKTANNLAAGDAYASCWNSTTGAMTTPVSLGAATKNGGFHQTHIVFYDGHAGYDTFWATWAGPNGIEARQVNTDGTLGATVSIAAGAWSGFHDAAVVGGDLYVITGEQNLPIYRISGTTTDLNEVALFAENLFKGFSVETDTYLEDLFFSHPELTGTPEGGLAVAVSRYYHFESFDGSTADIDDSSVVVRELIKGGWSGEATAYAGGSWNNVGGDMVSSADGLWISGGAYVSGNQTVFVVHRGIATE